MEEEEDLVSFAASPTTVTPAQIEPLPDSGLYDTFEQLLQHVQGHQRAHGAALVN